ncbi:MAG: CHAT domain-containing protein [Okeania sp. SIO3I5]|uniref:CHAT domain-containing protein n=1 Tax=Okeania sp. SIO3I5 TaxID=2607805 RepID=UPI0013BB15F4|nr:CHAT domain-containing protein [Okeania sp. SIO3I5]NEQ41153.1 CHAT domain-containing protein [Okeania sp. SIO3I5]
MSNNLVSPIEKFRPDEQEIYLTLKRDLSWREGFGILFVKCSPVQESLIIGKVKQDIPDKKIEVLKLEHSIDNLYDLIAEKVKDNPINVLFISGIEKSLALEDYIKRTLEKPKISHEKGSVSYLLGHLNWQRERFRDDFNCCLVFIVRKYTLKYLVRRAPDFFDWRSGIFEFPVDKEIDLLQHYVPFERYLEQEKQRKVSEDFSLFYQKKDIDTQEYVLLLEKLLLLEYENNGDLKFLYSVIKSNVDKLDNFFAELLQQWIIDTCSEVSLEEKEAIAGIVESLCIDISRFPLGRLSNILEIAITGLESILNFHPRETFPKQWATTLHNLGYVYSNRIFGEKAENLEQAIGYYQSALQVRIREDFPEDWATTQNNLAIAYTQRIRGERGENLESAISAYFRALEVRICKYFPVDWAKIKNNLGNAYIERIKGDKRENLEQAINCFYQSLKIYTKKNFPEDWATTQNNLGNAYRERIRGDKWENIEMAIACLEKALEVYTKQDFPFKWADTQNNLGNAYRARIRGDKAENIENAIAAFQMVLEVYTKKDLPLQWADTQNNLGNAYRARIRGDKAENIENAIAAFQMVLEVYTKKDLPLQWAETLNNLGNAYRERIRGDKAENIESAIAAFQMVLEVYTQQYLPLQWAETQNNLAIAYGNRIKGDRAENLEMAITGFQNSLQIFTPENLPIECLTVSHNLGNLYFQEANWQLAIEAYKIAIKAVEISCSWAITEISRQEIISQVTPLYYIYYSIVESYINLGQIDKAIEYVELSKNRTLVELIANRNLYPKGDISLTIIRKLDRLRREITIEEKRLAIEQNNHTDYSKPKLTDCSKLNQLQQELDKLISREINSIDAAFQLTQKVESITFGEMQNLIDDQTAIIEWYVTDNQIITFITTRHYNQPQILQFCFVDINSLKIERESCLKEDVEQEVINSRIKILSDQVTTSQIPVNKNFLFQDKRAFDEFVAPINKYLNLYHFDKRQWQSELSFYLRNFAQILHLDEIISHIPQQCQKIILIPHRFLHLLPIHAFILNDGSYLLDNYEVSYSPSCRLLQLIKNQQRPNFDKLFAIQNPTNDLIFTNLEVETISSYFDSAEILAKEKATKTAFKTYSEFSSVNCLHFSCHSSFNTNSPLESSLLLADAETLTLAEVFELNLSQCRLVSLSACETGLTDFNDLRSDEYISFPSSFIYAGSSNVVSSLWSPDDLSAALLMIKFYQNLHQNFTVSTALNKAQIWLRNITKQELRDIIKKLHKWIENNQLPINENLERKLKYQLKYRLQLLSNSEQPFKDPFYWAAFSAISQ